MCSENIKIALIRYLLYFVFHNNILYYHYLLYVFVGVKIENVHVEKDGNRKCANGKPVHDVRLYTRGKESAIHNGIDRA
jgi:hypothetical protein